jgi:hypothetical protein
LTESGRSKFRVQSSKWRELVPIVPDVSIVPGVDG